MEGVEQADPPSHLDCFSGRPILQRPFGNLDLFLLLVSMGLVLQRWFVLPVQLGIPVLTVTERGSFCCSFHSLVVTFGISLRIAKFKL